MKAQAQIKAWFRTEGRKQTWMAEKVGVDGPVISRWLNGHRVPTKKYRKELAKITGLDVASEYDWTS